MSHPKTFIIKKITVAFVTLSYTATHFDHLLLLLLLYFPTAPRLKNAPLPIYIELFPTLEVSVTL